MNGNYSAGILEGVLHYVPEARGLARVRGKVECPRGCRMTESFPGRPLIFGEVLFDHFPDGNRVLGGAPFNVAWHLQAFGMAPLFVSRVGDDEAGREVRSTMAAWGMDTRGLQSDPDHPTGAVTVSYDAGQPSFDILAGRAYDFIDADGLPDAAAALLYHGSLAARQAVSAHSLQCLKDAGAPVFVDVNLRDPWWQRGAVLDMLGDARWAKLNDEELWRLAGQGADVASVAAAFRERLDLELLVVTLGAEGALAVTAGGQVEARPQSGVEPVDPVGAGDAFASVLLLGLLSRWPLETTMARAQSFASQMVQRQGATVSDPAFYAPFREAWKLL